jgi:hypothetical protein
MPLNSGRILFFGRPQKTSKQIDATALRHSSITLILQSGAAFSAKCERAAQKRSFPSLAVRVERQAHLRGIELVPRCGFIGMCDRPSDKVSFNLKSAWSSL